MHWIPAVAGMTAHSNAVFALAARALCQMHAVYVQRIWGGGAPASRTRQAMSARLSLWPRQSPVAVACVVIHRRAYGVALVLRCDGGHLVAVVAVVATQIAADFARLERHRMNIGVR